MWQKVGKWHFVFFIKEIRISFIGQLNSMSMHCCFDLLRKKGMLWQDPKETFSETWWNLLQVNGLMDEGAVF